MFVGNRFHVYALCIPTCLWKLLCGWKLLFRWTLFVNMKLCVELWMGHFVFRHVLKCMGGRSVLNIWMRDLVLLDAWAAWKTMCLKHLFGEPCVSTCWGCMSDSQGHNRTALVLGSLCFNMSGLHWVAHCVKQFLFNPTAFWIMFFPSVLKGFSNPLTRCWFLPSLLWRWLGKLLLGTCRQQGQGQGQGQEQALMATACASVCRISPQTCGSYA